MKVETTDQFELLAPNYPKDDKYENIELEEKLVSIPKNRPVRIYCDGVFDMFHYGHARLFKQVKGMFPNVYLIVGVHSDEATNNFKGIVAMTEQERYESVSHCKYVDEIITDAPWIHEDLSFLKNHKIDFVAHDGDPYPSGQQSDIYGIFKENNMFLPTKRSTHVSTTKIITGIVKNYDNFIRRQVNRGVSYEDLNLSYLKREQIRFENILGVNKNKNMKYAFEYLEYIVKNPVKYFFANSSNIFNMLFRLPKKNK